MASMLGHWAVNSDVCGVCVCVFILCTVGGGGGGEVDVNRVPTGFGILELFWKFIKGPGKD